MHKVLPKDMEQRPAAFCCSLNAPLNLAKNERRNAINQAFTCLWHTLQFKTQPNKSFASFE